jgi:uncharacterized protein (TIGR03089 family)
VAATDSLLADALRRDPSGPLLTYYDDAIGERTELSATTLANWVAKTANLLVDELMLDPGDRVAVLLPAHWQTAAVLLAAWSAGAVVTVNPQRARVAFTDAEHLSAARAADEVVALSLKPMGLPFAQPPEGAQDYAAVVPAQPDVFASPAELDDTSPAVEVEDHVWPASAVVADARSGARWTDFSAGDRVMTVSPWSDFDDWRANFLSPLAVGASIVLCAHADPAALQSRAQAEKVTVTLGFALEGFRSLEN